MNQCSVVVILDSDHSTRYFLHSSPHYSKSYALELSFHSNVMARSALGSVEFNSVLERSQFQSCMTMLSKLVRSVNLVQDSFFLRK